MKNQFDDDNFWSHFTPEVTEEAPAPILQPSALEVAPSVAVDASQVPNVRRPNVAPIAPEPLAVDPTAQTNSTIRTDGSNSLYSLSNPSAQTVSPIPTDGDNQPLAMDPSLHMEETNTGNDFNRYQYPLEPSLVTDKMDTSNGSDRPTYADAVEEWNASGRPLITALQEYFKAPEEEIDPEQARRLKAAGALGDSLKILAEMYGDGQNATIRNRYGEATGLEQAEAEVDKATARYQQLLQAHNKLMGSAALDEIGRTHSDMMGDYVRAEQEKAQQAQSERAQELVRLKEGEARRTYGAKKAADLGLALQKYEMIDKPSADKAQKDRLALEATRNKYRLGQIHASGAEQRKTKRTPSASPKSSSRYVRQKENGNYVIRLEERATPWVDKNNNPISDPEMRRQENITKRTKDVEMTPLEYATMQQRAEEMIDVILSPEVSLDQVTDPTDRAFYQKLQGVPDLAKRDKDYLAKLYIQLAYENGGFDAPDDLLWANGQGGDTVEAVDNLFK